MFGCLFGHDYKIIEQTLSQATDDDKNRWAVMTWAKCKNCGRIEEHIKLFFTRPPQSVIDACDPNDWMKD